MGYWLSLKSTRASVDELVLINDWSATGYIRESGGDWGFVDNQGIFSGSIDTEGSSKVGERVENRTLTLPILIDGTTAAIVQTRWDALADMVGELREHKGTVRFRPSTATYGVDFEIEHARLENDYWPKLAELGVARRVNLVLTVRPYALMDPMDVEDDFSTDTLGTGGRYNNGGADWTRDAGAAGDLVITGGVLDAVTNLSTEQRLIHTGTPHEYGDCRAQITVAPGTTITSFKAGVIIRYIDALNYLEVYIDDDGANSRLRCDKVVAGSRTNLSSTNLGARITANTKFTLAGYMNASAVGGYYITGESFGPFETGSTSGGASLTGSDITLFGQSVQGRCGIVFIPQHTNAYIGDYRVSAYNFGSRPTVPVISPNGPIPGNIGARCDLILANDAQTAVLGAVAWTRRLPYNLCWNGSAREGTTGWTVAAVTGVNAAATSIAQTTPGYGDHPYAFQVVTPATSDSGASFAFYTDGAPRGRVTVKAWMRSTGGSTTSVRLKIGSSASIDSGTASALTTSWQEYTATSTDAAIPLYIAAVTASATATTFQISNVRVYIEGQEEPEANLGGYRPFGMVPAIGRQAAGAYFTQTTSAAYYCADGMQGSGATASNGTLDYFIDPSTVPMDDDGEHLVQLFARLRCQSTITGVTVIPSIRMSGSTALGNTSYTLEYGSTGRDVTTIVDPSSGTVERVVFLGTIPVKADDRQTLRLSFTVTGTGTFGVDYLHFVPVGQWFGSQTGVALSALPQMFVTKSNNTTEVKEILSDLSTVLKNYAASVQGGYRGVRDVSMIGTQFVVPSGDVDFSVMRLTYPIDRTDSNADTDTLSSSTSQEYAIRVRPRVLMGAG